MNREPINPDDPQMTAYALGELSVAEAAEFEARLQDSPMAARELASMREVMALLGEGLRAEWTEECERPALKLLEPVAKEAASEKVIEGNFRPARKPYVAAAAAVGILLTGSFVVTGLRDSGTGEKAIAENAPEMLVSPEVHSPQLFLAEEVSDLSSLDLVDGADGLAGEVDASYLESKSVVPASFIPGHPGKAAFSEDRVDSYLPPVRGTSLRGMNTGMIERRLGRVPVGGGDTRASSVLVSGYVTMGSENGAAEAPRFLGGFRPVAISGNPVVNEESDLRLLADLNGLQKELSEVIAGMPVENAERTRLERIRDRSDRVISQLKREISR